MLENSCAAISFAVAMVIGSNTVPAAITQVDARTGRKFTAASAIPYVSAVMWILGGMYSLPRPASDCCGFLLVHPVQLEN